MTYEGAEHPRSTLSALVLHPSATIWHQSTSGKRDLRETKAPADGQATQHTAQDAGIVEILVSNTKRIPRERGEDG